MSPDDTRTAEAAVAPLVATPPAHERIELWAGADTAADVFLVLRRDGSACSLLAPHDGWREVGRFAGYEAAYRWLAAEEYERVDIRCAPA